MKLYVIIGLFGVMLELVEFIETYKIIKPYKYYHPQPWRPPRWHPFSKPRKRYHPKRMPSHKSHYDHPHYHRYVPYYEDSAETSHDDKPYIIVIQLPSKKEKSKSRSRKREHVINIPRDIDYINDDDDELKVDQLDDKTVRIKVNDTDKTDEQEYT
ncbi:uncharacterized protein [Linepithema humile]|uniref:uncharacterized protein n=1 Tax=Linepithema humile TaxID=83485 RepID=UPI0006231691|nr:PREDICTED: uncharacterized protein LOC105670516 [Linepithema humile]